MNSTSDAPAQQKQQQEQEQGSVEKSDDLFDLLIKCVMKAEAESGCDCCSDKSKEERPWYGQDDTYRQKDEELVDKFVRAFLTVEEQQGVLNYRDKVKWGVWHHAARINSVTLIKFFCNHWGAALSSVPDLEQVVLLAVKHHSNDVVHYILHERANPEQKDASSFLESVKVKILEQALDCRNTEMALDMLPLFTADALTNSFGGTESKSGRLSLAMRAVKQNNLVVVKAMSKPYSNGVDFNNVTSSNGDTAVQWAAYDGCIDVMLFLLNHLHLDVNAEMGRSKNRLLYEAYMGNQFTAFTVLLLKVGANPNFFVVEPKTQIRRHFFEYLWYGVGVKRQKWLNPILSAFPQLADLPFDVLAENRLLPHTSLANMIAHVDVSRHWDLQRAAPSAIIKMADQVYNRSQ